jgi:chromate reductase
MAQTRIAVVVGSLRRESYNLQLANALAKLAPAELRTGAVAHRRPAAVQPGRRQEPGAAVLRLKGEITAAQGVLFVTPEYNRSIPGVLKNAIDNASRPYGQSAWAGKPAGVIGMSVGAIGTALAQQHLRNVLAYLDMPTLGQPEMFLQHKPGLFGPDGSIASR